MVGKDILYICQDLIGEVLEFGLYLLGSGEPKTL